MRGLPARGLSVKSMSDAASTHCLQLSPNLLLIAVPDGRCWLTEVGSSSLAALPISTVAAAHASLAASLVEGAIAAGLSRTGQASATGAYTFRRYLRWLVGNYLFAGTTPGLFRRGAERFEALGRPDLAEFARQKAAEEEGHAELAFHDLEAFGLPAAEVIRLIQPPSAGVFAESFRDHVESSTPIALFGFSYCLERMAVGRDEEFIRKVEAVCPPQLRAYRFLKVHSNIGSDSGHVDEQLSFFAGLTEPELGLVARAAYETAELLAGQPAMDQELSDAEIERRLRSAGIELSGARAQAGQGQEEGVI